MPRISLWHDGTHSKDFQFIDDRMREMFTAGGLGIAVYKYLGPEDQTGLNDPTTPDILNGTEKNIQDVLFLENRDRKYDTDVHILRGIYQPSDIDFDLSQFGLFLVNDTLFITFHLNDHVAMLGRKLMAGDVLELPNLKEYFSLDTTVPYGLKRFYVIQDAMRPAEGFSPTWWPHLWRVKCTPLVDSQEYASLLQALKAGDNTNDTLANVLSTYDQSITINDAIVEAAENEVPKSGYDTTPMYVEPVRPEDGGPGDPETLYSTDGSTLITVAETPDKSINGWLTGDGIAPDGYPVAVGISFLEANPTPSVGDFVLRTDYFPNRLFRWDGVRWVKVEDNVRTNYTPSASDTQKGLFINNTDTVALDDATTVDSKQGLSQVLKNRKR